MTRKGFIFMEPISKHKCMKALSQLLEYREIDYVDLAENHNEYYEFKNLKLHSLKVEEKTVKLFLNKKVNDVNASSFVYCFSQRLRQVSDISSFSIHIAEIEQDKCINGCSLNVSLNFSMEITDDFMILEFPLIRKMDYQEAKPLLDAAIAKKNGDTKNSNMTVFNFRLVAKIFKTNTRTGQKTITAIPYNCIHNSENPNEKTEYNSVFFILNGIIDKTYASLTDDEELLLILLETEDGILVACHECGMIHVFEIVNTIQFDKRVIK